MNPLSQIRLNNALDWSTIKTIISGCPTELTPLSHSVLGSITRPLQTAPQQHRDSLDYLGGGLNVKTLITLHFPTLTLH